MADKELDRNAARRLAIIRHAEEVTGNVAKTCRYYGVSQQNFVDGTAPLPPGGGDGHYNRQIEDQVTALGGSKGLYPTSYYCEEEFAERYNGAEYAKLLPEYDGGARLAGFYQKCVTVE